MSAGDLTRSQTAMPPFPAEAGRAAPGGLTSATDPG